MTAEDTLHRVAAIVRTTFKDPDAVVTAQTTADDVDGWDSLTHGVFLMNIERAFGIRFVPEDVIDLENVGDLIRAIDARLPDGRNN
jgi:acyl carrier protein